MDEQIIQEKISMILTKYERLTKKALLDDETTRQEELTVLKQILKTVTNQELLDIILFYEQQLSIANEKLEYRNNIKKISIEKSKETKAKNLQARTEADKLKEKQQRDAIIASRQKATYPVNSQITLQEQYGLDPLQK